MSNMSYNGSFYFKFCKVCNIEMRSHKKNYFKVKDTCEECKTLKEKKRYEV